MAEFGFGVMWAHLVALEAMYQDELATHITSIFGKLPGPLGDERWWRMRWLQEASQGPSTPPLDAQDVQTASDVERTVEQ